MIVMKFGGTSLEDPASVERVIQIVRSRLELMPVVVVSAMGKTTRQLLSAARAAAAGDTNSALGIVSELKAAHKAQAKALFKNGQAPLLIEQYFDELERLLNGLAILGEVPPRGLDRILSYGELLSSVIFATALIERGLKGRLFDSRALIKTDDAWGEASPIIELTNKNLRDALLPSLRSGEVPVLQGYIGSTREGATTTLGFEGSDYTATIVGAALEASHIEIWKDVPGLMTADPAIFPRARTVKACSFAEAAELTYFGAKVLHPKAIYPAAQKDIPVHIYNSKQPEATGTKITAAGQRCSNSIKSIAYKRPIALLGIARSDAASADMLRAVVDAIRRRRIAPLVMAASAWNLLLAIDGQLPGDARSLAEELSRVGRISLNEDKAIISLVGEGLMSDATSAPRALSATREIGIAALLHGSSPIAIHLIAEDRHVEELVAKLHDAFFQDPDPEVFE